MQGQRLTGAGHSARSPNPESVEALLSLIRDATQLDTSRTANLDQYHSSIQHRSRSFENVVKTNADVLTSALVKIQNDNATMMVKTSSRTESLLTALAEQQDKRIQNLTTLAEQQDKRIQNLTTLAEKQDKKIQDLTEMAVACMQRPQSATIMYPTLNELSRKMDILEPAFDEFRTLANPTKEFAVADHSLLVQKMDEMKLQSDMSHCKLLEDFTVKVEDQHNKVLDAIGRQFNDVSRQAIELETATNHMAQQFAVVDAHISKLESAIVPQLTLPVQSHSHTESREDDVAVVTSRKRPRIDEQVATTNSNDSALFKLPQEYAVELVHACGRASMWLMNKSGQAEDPALVPSDVLDNIIKSAKCLVTDDIHNDAQCLKLRRGKRGASFHESHELSYFACDNCVKATDGRVCMRKVIEGYVVRPFYEPTSNTWLNM
ncbi:hypothetical protein J1614_011710 [Plenodomus biglobosus]|nr:hypothetical protein J1614_011710 [Plenodomus biglobosus]